MKVSLNSENFQFFSLLCLPRDSAFAGLVPAFMSNLIFITMLEHFFGQRPKVRPTYDDKALTILLATESDGNGNTVIMPKCVEVENNPACLLTFEDFRLQAMLDAGIKPQHLAISQDNRIGITDSEINAFAERVNNILSNSEN